MLRDKTQNMKLKVHDTVDKGKRGVSRAVIVAESAMLGFSSCMTANAAAGGVGIAPTSNLTMEGIAGSVIGFILTLMRYVGVALLVYGVYQIYLSFKDDNADSKVKSFTLAFVAIGLITIKAVLGPNMLGILTY